ncbi:MAG: AgmX/PglI C-terminal domain-containing protein [Nannocystaceae bacterium]
MCKSALRSRVRHVLPCLLATLCMATTGCKKPAETEVPEPAVEDDAPPADADADADADAEPAGEGLSFEDFQETADYRTHTVIACYDKTAGSTKTPATGKVEVSFTIAGDGSVTDFKFTEGSTLNDEALNTCIDNEVRAWKFDEGGAEVTHPFTFDLRPGELLPPPS